MPARSCGCATQPERRGACRPRRGRRGRLALVTALEPEPTSREPCVSCSTLVSRLTDDGSSELPTARCPGAGPGVRCQGCGYPEPGWRCGCAVSPPVPRPCEGVQYHLFVHLLCARAVGTRCATARPGSRPPPPMWGGPLAPWKYRSALASEIASQVAVPTAWAQHTCFKVITAMRRSSYAMFVRL